MNEITYGYAEIDYVTDDQQRFRVSTVIKEGNHVNKFIQEIYSFLILIKSKCPISLSYFLFVGSFVDNKSDNVIREYKKVI